MKEIAAVFLLGFLATILFMGVVTPSDVGGFVAGITVGLSIVCGVGTIIASLMALIEYLARQEHI